MQGVATNQEPQARREAYEPPRIQTHGSVAKLTKMPKGGTLGDGTPGTKSRA